MNRIRVLITCVVLLTLAVLVVDDRGVVSAQGLSPSTPPQTLSHESSSGINVNADGTFTYQGQLKFNGNPYNGTCDFSYSSYSTASGGSPDGPYYDTNITVNEGLFSMPIGVHIEGEQIWIEIGVSCPHSGSPNYTILSPRQKITAAPYANVLVPNSETKNFSSVDGSLLSDVQYATDREGISASTSYNGNVGLRGTTDATSDTAGVVGISFNTGHHNGNFGVVGLAGLGVYADISTIDADAGGAFSGPDGVIGVASIDSPWGTGVYGVASGLNGIGIDGYESSPGGITYGVYGKADSNTGTGVEGIASADNGPTYGVYGLSSSNKGTGLEGEASATTGPTYGVYGLSDSNSGTGVEGKASSTTGNTYGVYGSSSSSDGTGVYGLSNNIGVEGVRGNASGAVGGLGAFPAVLGDTNTGDGVVGVTSADGMTGVWGEATGSGAVGVYGEALSPNSYAGLFSGNVEVGGNLQASGTKAFKIDDPLDPANKYLLHYAVESPQVQNQYNGTVTLDANGEAVVSLPEYFSAINTGPYSYQLTAIGAPGPNLYIAEEVTGNQFKIAGGTPGLKVSWLLYGQRNDPWMQDNPQSDVVNKPASEAGTYLYPQGYGQPASSTLGYQSPNNTQNITPLASPAGH
jgi:hypothetical protein